MASITIRNLDEDIKRRLRLCAAGHGWSMEEEARNLRYSLIATNSQHLCIFTEKTLAEANGQRCSYFQVIAQGERQCGAALTFFLLWNTYNVIGCSTSHTEEKVTKSCQLRGATSRDCSEVRSFCGAGN